MAIIYLDIYTDVEGWEDIIFQHYVLLLLP